MTPSWGIQRRSQVTTAGGRSRIGGLLDHLNLVVEFGDATERSARGNTVYEHEALPIPNPLVPQGSVLLLSGCVQHLEHTGLLVDDNLLSV